MITLTRRAISAAAIGGYQEKVRRHFSIAAWAYSNREGDPGLRQVMTLLLENGYGIEDYAKVMPPLARYSSEVAALRERYRKVGFYTEAEIDVSLEERRAFHRQEAHLKSLEFVLSMYGITDERLIGELSSVDLGIIREGDGAIGEGKVETLWGDRLLGKADWLDADFQAARTCYRGAPRGSAEERLTDWHKQRRREREQRQARRLAPSVG
ncbi:MAG: hypothetical protein M2R45_03817 [Verrucomicrobia subdivision 3 bacterium]|nr:hypothetical protein [Limisphaerales bacterium]MCS1415773.1 hypothetical protein [Limisphaerales bacterium]